jgi:hypothetical protein
MNVTCIGRCSLCRGRVVVPTIWHGVIPPRPTCERCKAVASDNPDPVTIITMEQVQATTSNQSG